MVGWLVDTGGSEGYARSGEIFDKIDLWKVLNCNDL